MGTSNSNREWAIRYLEKLGAWMARMSWWWSRWLFRDARPPSVFDDPCSVFPAGNR